MILTLWGLRNEIICCDSTLDKFLDELDKYEPTQPREVHVEDIVKSVAKLNMIEQAGTWDRFMDYIDKQKYTAKPFFLKGLVHQDPELVINKLNGCDRLYYMEGFFNMSLEIIKQYQGTLDVVMQKAETYFPHVQDLITKMKIITTEKYTLDDKTKIKGDC